MVGCCNIGPCRKKRSYEFNNPAYNKNNEAETYKQNCVLVDQEDGASGTDPAQVHAFGTHPEGEMDGDPDLQGGINGVVAVDLDSNSPSVVDGYSELGDKNEFLDSNVKQCNEKIEEINQAFDRRSSNRSSKSSNHNKICESETSLYGGSIQCNKEECKEAESDISGGAIPYPEDSSEIKYTTIINHQMRDTIDEADSDISKRISNVSSTLNNYDPSDEGHFHSEHNYTKDNISNENIQNDVDIPREAEALDNMMNDIVEDNSNGYTSVTETSIIHVNSSDTGINLDSHDQLY